MVFHFARLSPLLSLGLLLCLPQQQPYVLAADSSSSSDVAATVSTDGLIGWFNCSSNTFKDQPSATNSINNIPGSYDGWKPWMERLESSECAQYQAPLCHAGICEDDQDRTVNVFVKRLLAKEKPESKPNVWFFQGGPGYASPTMESAMRNLYIELEGNVNVYTMDHRGTGRSNQLDCVAAQATTSGSPSGSDIDVSEVTKCAEEFQIKYGDMAAFSITSAATDISTFISKYQSGSKTFVYGVSYGSALVERLIHLDTKEIVGYILDGISTTSGGDVKDAMYMSNWDTNFGEVSDHFLSLLATNSKAAASKFVSKSISTILKNLLADFDKNPGSKCATLVSDFYSTAASRPGYNTESTSASSTSVPASRYVKSLLGQILMYAETRGYIPVVIYRLERCSKDDRKVLLAFFAAMDKIFSTPSEQEALVSLLEYYLIVFSEMWESPTPDVATMTERFTNAAISTGPIAAYLPLYCAFTKDTSSACAALNVSSSSSAPAIAYKKDKYWNVAATIPEQASVLIMSGKLDPQTPHKYAERLFQVLDGTKKELVAFEYAAHGTLLNTVYNAFYDVEFGYPTSTPRVCGSELLASYVKNGGDLSKLDKTCVGAANAFMADLDANEMYNPHFLGFWGDAYEGEAYYYASNKYKTPLVIASVAAAFLLFGIAVYACRARERRARNARNPQVHMVTDVDASHVSPTNEASYRLPVETEPTASRV